MNFPSQMFLGILVMVTEQLYWRKIICGYFRFTWLLIAIMKWCTERCTLQLHRTSLSCHVRHGVKVGPGPRDSGPREPRTRDLGPPSKLGRWNEGFILVLMSHVCYLAVILIFWWLLGDYCSLPSGYWWLLLVTARYFLFPLLVWCWCCR